MNDQTPAVVKLTCEDVIGLLLEYLETALTPDTLAAFERHLAGCAPCVAYLRTYRKTRDITAAGERVEMPADMKARIREFLTAVGGLAAPSPRARPAPGTPERSSTDFER